LVWRKEGGRREEGTRQKQLRISTEDDDADETMDTDDVITT